MSAAAAPRVVACMPAWNAAPFVRPVLESLAAQTYENLEVLISVDPSTDDTAEICTEFARGRPQFRVVRQPRRLGWIGNANALLSAASGQYVFFAFHDDPLRPQYVARCVAALEAAPAAVLAYSDVDAENGGFTYDALDGARTTFERARRVFYRYGHWWVPNRGVMPTSVVRRLGGMRRHAAGEFSADFLWLLRLALEGDFVRVPGPLLFKSFRRDSLSATWRKGTRHRLALQAAAIGIVLRARLSLAQKTRLLCGGVWYALKYEAYALKRRRLARSGAADDR